MSTTQTTAHYSEAITLTITVHATTSTSTSTTDSTTDSPVSSSTSNQEVPAMNTPSTPTIAPTSPMPMQHPLIPQRALLVLMLAFIIGTGIGALTFASTHDLATAVLAGASAAGAVTKNHNLIE